MGMNTLDSHMELQKKLMDVVGASATNEESVKNLLIVTALCIIDEALEVVEFAKDSTKPWKKPEFNQLSIKEEIIDVYFFVLQLFVLMGMNENEIDAMYRFKNQKNFERIKAKVNAITN